MEKKKKMRRAKLRKYQKERKAWKGSRWREKQGRREHVQKIE